MKLKEILDKVGGSVLTKKADLNCEVLSCGASDLMSDVLTFMTPCSLLLTGLVNLQSVRTAEMADVAAIIYVRGKTPDPEIIKLAEELGIPLIKSSFSMYELCGRLYQTGLPPSLK